MAVYTLTAPDGYSYDVTAPDSATEQEVKAYAKAHYKGAPPADKTWAGKATSIVKNSPPGVAAELGTAAVKAIDPEFQWMSDAGRGPAKPPPPANDEAAGYWQGKGDYPPAGAEVPLEQRLVENAIKVGNTAGAADGAAGLAEGLAGLAVKGAGAISEGLGPKLSSWGDTVGSWIPNGWRDLPENGLKAAEEVQKAAHYAMNPHPEVQQALMDLAAQTRGPVAEEAGGAMAAGELTVRPSPPSPAGSAAADIETGAGKGASVVRVPPTGPNEIIPTPTILDGQGNLFRDPRTAFEQAIKEGRLSKDPSAENYAGNYMYMGPTTDGAGDAFKNIMTRKYLPNMEPPAPGAAAGLPVMPGSTTGKPYALFDYHDFAGDHYKIYGDPELTGIKTTGDQSLEYLREHGIPVTGKTARAAEMGHEPLGGEEPPRPSPEAIPLFGEGESTAKMVPYERKPGDIPSGPTIELPGESPTGAEVGPVSGEEPPVLEGEVVGGPEKPEPPAGPETAIPNQLSLFDEPIFSMANMTPQAQLAATERQMQAVGKGIQAQYDSLSSSGKGLDMKQVLDDVAAKLIRKPDGTNVPAPGMGGYGWQAENNQSVSYVLSTLENEALHTYPDGKAVLEEVSWDNAGRIKTALQRKAEDTGDPIIAEGARLLRNAIDDQGEALLRARGDNIAPFQQLRDAYGRLAKIHSTLNSQVLSGLRAKNQIPVVRTLVGAGGIATHNPKLAAVAGADWFGRKYGTLAFARGLHNAGEAAEGVSNAGKSLDLLDLDEMLKRGGRGIAAGLTRPDND